MELYRVQEKDLDRFLKMQILTFQSNGDTEGMVDERPEDLRKDLRKADFYMFLKEDVTIGGASVLMLKKGTYQIQRFFIHPDFQNRRLGRRAMKLLIDRYPWETIRLYTPVHHARNLHFYEGLGFVRLYDKKVSETYSLAELELRRNAI